MPFEIIKNNGVWNELAEARHGTQLGAEILKLRDNWYQKTKLEIEARKKNLPESREADVFSPPAALTLGIDRLRRRTRAGGDRIEEFHLPT